MLTVKSKAVINAFVGAGTWLGCHPLRWENEKKIRLIVSKTTPWMWYIYSLVIFFYGIFNFCRLFQSLVVLRYPIETTVIHMFYAITYVFYWGNNSSYLFRKHEIAEFITCLINFDSKFPSKYPVQFDF